jgi:hypothetical protein
MRGQYRLGSLGVRIARQDHIGIGIAATDERFLRIGQTLINFVNRFANPKPKVSRDLIVATPSSMQLATYVAEAIDEGLLNMHVDVFQFCAEWEAALLNLMAYVAQGLLNCPAFIGSNEADFGQHLCVSDRSLDILPKQTAIEAHTFGELLHATIGRYVKNSAPSFLRQRNPRTFNQDASKINNLVSLNDLRRIVNELSITEAGATND